MPLLFMPTSFKYTQDFLLNFFPLLSSRISRWKSLYAHAYIYYKVVDTNRRSLNAKMCKWINPRCVRGDKNNDFECNELRLLINSSIFFLLLKKMRHFFFFQHWGWRYGATHKMCSAMQTLGVSWKDAWKMWMQHKTCANSLFCLKRML